MLPRSMNRYAHLVMLLLFAIGCSILSLTVWKVSAGRERVLEEVDAHGLNLTQALDNHLEEIFRNSSLLSRQIVEKVEEGGGGISDMHFFRTMVGNSKLLLPQLLDITIYNEHGQGIISLNQGNPLTTNSFRRTYFIHHLSNPSRQIIIGPRIWSRVYKEWLITVSMRFNNPNGEFAGVVVVSLSVENLLQFFGEFDLGQDGTIELFHADGTLLIRYPAKVRVGGGLISNPIMDTRFLKNNSAMTSSFISNAERIEKVYTFRKSERFPLVTTVAIDRSDALKAWRIGVMLDALMFIVLVVITCFIGVLLIVDIRKRTEAEN